jgi:hypothetical protein
MSDPCRIHACLPGTHIPLLRPFTPDQVGIGGDANQRARRPFAIHRFSTDDRPDKATQLCAIVANPDHSVVPNSGNCFLLPSLPAIELTGITLDAQQRYAVDFVVKDFVPTYPGGTHIHFYFNTFTADQVGIGGNANRRSYGGSPPFTDYGAADRPEGATQLCAIVANPDHSVLPNSGNCYPPAHAGVQITGITVDNKNRYVVDYVTFGFTSHWPGTRPLFL